MLSVAESAAATLDSKRALMMTNDFGIYASAGYAPRGSRFSRAFYLFSWSLVGVGGVAGLLFSLYRNDVLLNEARRRGMEKPYLALERRLLGTPGWGTPRSLLTSSELPGSTAAALSAPEALAATTPSPAETKPASATESAPTHAAEAKSKPPTPSASAGVTSEGVKITSLEALAPLPRGAAAARIAAPVTRSVVEARPSHSETRVAERKPAVAARSLAASEPKPKAAPPAAKPAPEPSPARAKKAAPVDDNPLNAAIRGVIAKDASGK